MSGSVAVARPAPTSAAVLAAFAVIYFVWGATFLATRYAVESFPPFMMRGAACVVAGCALYFWARRGGAAVPTPRQWAHAVVAALLLFVLCQGVLAWAQQQVASGIAALTAATIPLWIPLLAWALPGGTPPRANTAASVLLGLLGVGLLVWSGGKLDGGGVAPGMALILLGCALSWALGTVLLRRMDRPADVAMGMAAQLAAGGAMLWLLGLGLGEAWPRVSDVPARGWAAIGFHTFANYLLAFGCYTWLLQRRPAEQVATYAYVNPLVAVGLGWLLAGERVTPYTVLAMALILGAVAVQTGLPGRAAAAAVQRPAE